MVELPMLILALPLLVLIVALVTLFRHRVSVRRHTALTEELLNGMERGLESHEWKLLALELAERTWKGSWCAYYRKEAGPSAIGEFGTGYALELLRKRGLGSGVEPGASYTGLEINEKARGSLPPLRLEGETLSAAAGKPGYLRLGGVWMVAVPLMGDAGGLLAVGTNRSLCRGQLADLLFLADMLSVFLRPRVKRDESIVKANAKNKALAIALAKAELTKMPVPEITEQISGLLQRLLTAHHISIICHLVADRGRTLIPMFTGLKQETMLRLLNDRQLLGLISHVPAGRILQADPDTYIYKQLPAYLQECIRGGCLLYRMDEASPAEAPSLYILARSGRIAGFDQETVRSIEGIMQAGERMLSRPILEAPHLSGVPMVDNTWGGFV